MRKLLLAAMALTVSISVASNVQADIRQKPADLNTYILLDRTGSMSSMWAEALSSVNAYAENVGRSDPSKPFDRHLNTRVTLAVFDAQDGLQFNVLRDKVAPLNWQDVTNAEASPRGMTPLYDAIGQIIATASKDNPKKAVIVIMTDGQENASREMTQKSAKAALDAAKKRGWEVVFLGADFSNFSDADGVGIERTKSMAVDKSALGETMQRLAKKSRDYGVAAPAAPAPVTFDAEDRAAAKEEAVKQKQGQ
ncbi:vWA domain-containing protein [Asticcacaulis sp. ZE23SCel15]|uniref:vWA domain-containing protein n=1 Tax=Asticcacaulis sp. ZE23SCel15 TaxID=3059027 RepID=UPI00265FC498|nr:vWA domain-containing protein [Asticcacaulis sp. ZE23SCel15]WKL58166.1 vWA domain-containing protein [Asticcacaulis sp. ZE23SCel15]